MAKGAASDPGAVASAGGAPAASPAAAPFSKLPWTPPGGHLTQEKWDTLDPGQQFFGSLIGNVAKGIYSMTGQGRDEFAKAGMGSTPTPSIASSPSPVPQAPSVSPPTSVPTPAAPQAAPASAPSGLPAFGAALQFSNNALAQALGGVPTASQMPWRPMPFNIPPRAQAPASPQMQPPTSAPQQSSVPWWNQPQVNPARRPTPAPSLASLTRPEPPKPPEPAWTPTEINA